MFSGSEPALDGEVGHARELSGIRGDDGQTKAARLGGDQKIIAANRGSRAFQVGADGGIGLVRRRVETQDRDLGWRHAIEARPTDGSDDPIEA